MQDHEHDRPKVKNVLYMFHIPEQGKSLPSGVEFVEMLTRFKYVRNYFHVNVTQTFSS